MQPEDDAEVERREVDDSLDEIIAAFDLRDRGTVGCCFFVAREEKLYLTEDSKYGGLEVIDTRKYSVPPVSPSYHKRSSIVVKLQIQPTVVILSMRVDEIAEAYFDPHGRNRGSVDGDSEKSRMHTYRQLIRQQTINLLCHTY